MRLVPDSVGKKHCLSSSSIEPSRFDASRSRRPAVCPARFLITPTTVVLRSSWGDKTHPVFSTGDNSDWLLGQWIVSRLIKVECRPVSRSRANVSRCPCHASENLFFPPPSFLNVLRLSPSFRPGGFILWSFG